MLPLLLALSASASAAPPPVPSPDATAARPPCHEVSVTFAPVLAIALLQVEGEARLSDRFSASAILGTGSIGTFLLGGRLYNVGGQLRAYPVGDFDRGWDVAFEVLDYGGSSHLLFENLGRSDLLLAGPLVGYKHVARYGLTVDVQLGAAWDHLYGDVDPDAEPPPGVIPEGHLNVGWSFGHVRGQAPPA